MIQQSSSITCKQNSKIYNVRHTAEKYIKLSFRVYTLFLGTHVLYAENQQLSPKFNE